MFVVTFILIINYALLLTESDVYRSRSILGLNDVNETLTEAEIQILKSSTTESSTTTRQPINPRHAPKNCTNAAILELPSDGFTRDQRKQGWIAIHILLSCYCFWFLASICDDYFVPAIQSICSCKLIKTS